ncbi:hypothetical protein A9993_04190 [Rahnella victoriana]|uniref:YebO family protein n=1 Tax=Rahnella victoriana TaxID=1510570 RepID=UPI000BB19102|nr:YebO family protein [Rahnella victoriana]PBI82336.1 hypothetical protein A9993_04190 [Rahnella victoriana]
MDSTSISLVWVLIISLIGIVIWFFLNRASVRANRQIELLESIDLKLSLLANAKEVEIIHKETIESASKQKTDAEYLAEARQKAGL